MTDAVKKSAVYENIIIKQAEDNSVSVSIRNVKQALREISEKIGMEYDKEWNTQYFGHRVINFLNGVDSRTAKKKAEEEGLLVDNSNEDEPQKYISDADWEWWCNLEDELKYVLLYNLESEEGLITDESFSMTWNEDGCFDECSWDLYDKEGPIGSYIGEYFLGFYVNGERQESEYYVSRLHIPDNLWGTPKFAKFAYLKNVTTLDFAGSGFSIDESYFNQGWDQLETLVLVGCDVDEDSLTYLYPLKNLKELVLDDDAFDEDGDEISELKEHLPDCEVIFNSDW